MKNLLKTLILTTALVTTSFAGGGGDILRATVMVENFEYQFSDEGVHSWDAYAYVGYDLNKVYIYTEGEKAEDELAESENQLVYSRAIAPYWDIQLGVGYDKTPEADYTWGVIGIQGLAPYFFETRAVLLVGEEGEVGIGFEAEYEALLTQKLILSPSIEFSAYSKDIPEMGLGEGLSNLTLGLRLRYEFVREFAPYIGVEWSKNYGNTDDYHSLNETYATAGVRFWF